MPNKYDVFEFDEPLFEIVCDDKAPRVFDRDRCEKTELAHGVTAAVAVELIGLPPHRADHLESEVAETGLFAVGSLTDNYEVRLSCDD